MWRRDLRALRTAIGTNSSYGGRSWWNRVMAVLCSKVARHSVPPVIGWDRPSTGSC